MLLKCDAFKRLNTFCIFTDLGICEDFKGSKRNVGTEDQSFCVYLRELKEQLKYSAEFQENENAWQEKHNMMLNMDSSKRRGGPERRQLGEQNKRAGGREEKNQKEKDLRDSK